MSIQGNDVDRRIDQFAQFNYGELLVAKIIEILIKKKSLKGYKFPNKESADFSSRFKDFKGMKINQALDNIIRNKEVLKFNGQHNIDISILMEDENYPVEVKLGKSNRSERFPSTFFKFKAKSIKVDKKNKQFSGNMIKILDERKDLDGNLINLTSNGTNISRKWSLVIRSDSFFSWQLLDSDKFENLEYVFVFEEMYGLLTQDERDSLLIFLTNELQGSLSKISSFV